MKYLKDNLEIKNISKEEFEKNLRQATSYSEACRSLGLSYQRFKKLMTKYGFGKEYLKKLSVEHKKEKHSHRLNMLTIDQLKDTVARSKTYTEVARRLNYSPTNSLRIKKHIEKLGIDTSHFYINRVMQRLQPEQFCKIVVENLAQESFSYYEFIRKCGFSPEKDGITYAKNILEELNIDTHHFRKTSWGHDEFVEAIGKSSSIKDVLRHLGLQGQNNYKTVKKYIKTYNLDISHFKTNFEI